jgi:PilZ domain
MDQDKRTSERLLANLPVRWEGLAGTLGARTEDISVRGCFVNTLSVATPGELICLEIRLPSGEWFPVNGQVRSYLPGMGFGLQFRFASIEEEIVLRKLLTSLTIGLLSSESLQSPEPDLHA